VLTVKCQGQKVISELKIRARYRVCHRDDTVVVVLLQAKTAELNAMNVKVEEVVRSGVEKDVEAGKELSARMKTLLTQFDKLSATVDKRVKMAANNVSFQKRVKQVRALQSFIISVRLLL